MKALSQKKLRLLREAYEVRNFSKTAYDHWIYLMEKYVDSLLVMAEELAKQKADFDKLEPQEWR